MQDNMNATFFKIVTDGGRFLEALECPPGYCNKKLTKEASDSNTTMTGVKMVEISEEEFNMLDKNSALNKIREKNRQ